MRILLDTHVFLWWVRDDSRLDAPARDLISNYANEIFVSAVSAWEIEIKAALGKLKISPPEKGDRPQIPPHLRLGDAASSRAPFLPRPARAAGAPQTCHLSLFTIHCGPQVAQRRMLASNGMPSKCRSRVSSRAECWRALAAIQMSLMGRGVPARRRYWKREA